MDCSDLSLQKFNMLFLLSVVEAFWEHCKHFMGDMFLSLFRFPAVWGVLEVFLRKCVSS